MTERALSEAAMLAGLRDIRLPAGAPGGGLADLAAAIALAAAAALIVLQVLRLFSRRRALSAAPGRPNQLQDQLQGQPNDARRVALLHILKDRAPERFSALRHRLYSPDNPLELPELEHEVARIV